MPKQTIAQKLAAGLTALGWTELSHSPTRKARTFRIVGNTNLAFVGRSGSLRLGQNYTVSFVPSVRFRAMVLEAGGAS